MDVFQIKNLPTRLNEVGKIKIGKKGKTIVSGKGNKFQPPQKLNHFIVTQNVRGADGNYLIDTDIMEKLGGTPTEIPVMLLYDDIELNFQTRYAIFKGTKCVLEGDGESWKKRDDNGNWVKCGEPTKQLDPAYAGKDKCKMNGSLSVVIRNAEVVGGIWKFRTTGFNSVTSINSSLQMISFLTGGHLAGIPLWLTMNPKTGVNPKTGEACTFNVVNIVFKGAPELLREKGLETIKAGALYHEQTKRIEQKVKEEMRSKPFSFDEEPLEIIDEFYPEIAEENIRLDSDQSVLEKLSEGDYEEVAVDERTRDAGESNSEEHDELDAKDGEVEEESDGDEVQESTESDNSEDSPEDDVEESDSGDATETTGDESESEDDDDSVAKENIKKILKMRSDAIERVEACKYIKDLEKLKKGIGYKYDFGDQKADADAVVTDVLELINQRIDEIRSKNNKKKAPETTETAKTEQSTSKETKDTTETSNVKETPKTGVVEESAPKTDLPPHEQLKVLLIEEGLDSNDLRNTFYKKYPMKPEEYLENMTVFRTNVDSFKKTLILSLKRNLPAMIDKLDMPDNEKKDIQKYYNGVDKESFKDMMAFYADIKRS